MLVLTLDNSRNEWSHLPDAAIMAGGVALIFLPLLGLAVAGRRYQDTGRWPGGRHAP
jgi:hypothetical protein